MKISRSRSRLIARVERGERIHRPAGKPVAELRPVSKSRRFVPVDDPLLRVDEYSYDGPIGLTTDRANNIIVCS